MNTVPKPLWIMTVPVISTAHLDEATASVLSSQEIAGCNGPWGLLVMPAPEAGCILFIGDDPIDVVIEEMDEDVPKCIKDIFTKMKAMGYAWVRLDRDSDVIEGLPVYDR